MEVLGFANDTTSPNLTYIGTREKEAFLLLQYLVCLLHWIISTI